MPVLLDAEIEGEKQLSRRLLIVSDGISDWKDPLHNIAGALHNAIESNFDSRGGLFGGWAPAAKDYGHPLLEKTGDMRGAFGDEINTDFLKISNPTPYFPYHQSNQPRSRLPRRVMMKLDQQRKTFIQKAFQEHIVKTIRNSKRGD